MHGISLQVRVLVPDGHYNDVPRIRESGARRGFEPRGRRDLVTVLPQDQRVESSEPLSLQIFSVRSQWAVSASKGCAWRGGLPSHGLSSHALATAREEHAAKSAMLCVAV